MHIVGRSPPRFAEFLSTPDRNSVPTEASASVPSLPASDNSSSALWLCELACSRHYMQVELYGICPSVSGSLHLAWYSKSSPMSSYASEPHSCSCLNNSPLLGHSAVCFIHRRTWGCLHLWAVVTHAAMNAGMQVSLQVPAFSPPGSGIAQSCSNSVLAFWRNAQLFSWKTIAFWSFCFLVFLSFGVCLP